MLYYSCIISSLWNKQNGARNALDWTEATTTSSVWTRSTAPVFGYVGVEAFKAGVLWVV